MTVSVIFSPTVKVWVACETVGRKFRISNHGYKSEAEVHLALMERNSDPDFWDAQWSSIDE